MDVPVRASKEQMVAAPAPWAGRPTGAVVSSWLGRRGLTRSSLSEISLLLPLAGACLLLTGPSVLRGLAAGSLMLLGHLLDRWARQLPPEAGASDLVEDLTGGVRLLLAPLVLVAVGLGISRKVPVLAVVALALALAVTAMLLTSSEATQDPVLLYVLVLAWGLDDVFGPLFLALAVGWVAGTFRETPEAATAGDRERAPVPSGGDDAPRSSVIFGATVRTFRY